MLFCCTEGCIWVIYSELWCFPVYPLGDDGKGCLSDVLWGFRGQQGPSISCCCRTAGEACKAPWKLMGSSKGNLKAVEIWVRSPGLALGIVFVTGGGCTRCVAAHLTQVKITGRAHKLIFSYALFGNNLSCSHWLRGWGCSCHLETLEEILSEI